MNSYDIIDKYYSDNAKLRDLLVTHSELVTAKALKAAEMHPELDIDAQFVKECCTTLVYFLLMLPAFIVMAKNRIYAMAFWARNLCERKIIRAMPVYVNVIPEQD